MDKTEIGGVTFNTYTEGDYKIHVRPNPIFDTPATGTIITTDSTSTGTFTWINMDEYGEVNILSLAQLYEIEYPYDMEKDDPVLLEWIREKLNRRGIK